MLLKNIFSRDVNHPGEHRGGNQGYRGLGGGRGGFQPGRPTANPKFEGEYDFDKANEECKVKHAYLYYFISRNRKTQCILNEYAGAK